MQTAYKSSGFTEIGDRLATIDMGRKEREGLLCPCSWEELGPHLTQCGLGRDHLLSPHLDPSSRLATTDIGRKLEVAVPRFSAGGAGYPSNIISPGLRPTSVPSDILIHPDVWSQQICMGRKLGTVPLLFEGRGAGSPSNTMWLWPMPTSLPSGVFIHPPFGHNRQAENWGLCSLRGAPSNTMWSGPRPTSIPSGILIHPIV